MAGAKTEKTLIGPPILQSSVRKEIKLQKVIVSSDLLAPKLRLGNAVLQAPAFGPSLHRKQELPIPGSQSGDWEPAKSLGVHVERNLVSSSNLYAVGYDAVSKTLEIEFRESGVYQYMNVPTSTYEGLMSARSKGKYFDDHIKQRFSYRKISN